MTAQHAPETILAGLDDEVWPAIGFSRGTAADPAGTLRSLVSADDENVREDALGSFWGALRSRVPAYPATAQVVPYLARACAAGIHQEALLELLHSVARGEDQPRNDQDELTAAVAAQVPLLLPLLAHDDQDIKRWLIRIVLRSGRSPETAEAIRARWAEESDPALCSALLSACRIAGPDVAAEIAAGELGPDRDPEIRLVAALNLVRDGASWTDELEAAAITWARQGSEAEPVERWFDMDSVDWKDTDPDDQSFELLLQLLADRGELPVALRLLDAVLAAEGPGAGTRGRRALAAIEPLCVQFRAAPALLAPRLASLVTHQDLVVAGTAIEQLRRLGEEGRPAADALLTHASGERVAEAEDEFDAEDADEVADNALAALVDLGDPRAVPLLARDLPHRKEALETAAGISPSSRHDKPSVPFDPRLLDAARDLIRHPDSRNYSAPWYLCTLLASWGPQAAPALPELYTLLPKERQYAPDAVAAAAAGTEAAAEAADRLREAAEDASVYDRMPAAEALHRLTGDIAQLVEAIRPGLDDILYSQRDAMDRAGRLGPAGEPLLPRLRELLVPGEEWGLDDCLTAASAVRAIAGESAADELIPVLAQGLESQYPVIRASAVGVASRLGAGAAPLAERIAPLLESLKTFLPAARALLAIPGAVGPEGVVDREELTEALLAAVDSARDPGTAIDLLRDLGGGSLPAAVVDRLRESLTAERRPPLSGFDLHRVSTDRQRRAALRAALGE
ncbi:hypothetical protein ACH4S9_34655 [Streptomyces sp. NPDC021225]|uniref:hypothetical protein n=1 Tax=Streptomyces sp. NPDC021225 TaxID=3365121 RepID=UPI0037B1EDCE